EDLDALVLGNKNVFRLQIAMNDAGAVGGAQTTCEFNAPIQHLPYAGGASLKSLAKVFPLEQFGNDVRCTFPLSHVEDRDNVGMAQRGGGLRLDSEAAEPVGIADPVARENLDRDLA